MRVCAWALVAISKAALPITARCRLEFATARIRTDTSPVIPITNSKFCFIFESKLISFVLIIHVTIGLKAHSHTRSEDIEVPDRVHTGDIQRLPNAPNNRFDGVEGLLA